MTRNDPELAGKVCLALVAEGPTHGWAIAGLLAPGTELGRIWSLSRPLTYRALDGLLSAGLIERVGTEPGAGRNRTVVALTSDGARLLDQWLSAPVELPRDVRTELLVKFALRARRGLPNAGLAAAQRQRFASMSAAVHEPEIDTAPDVDIVERWRVEHLRAIDRFLSAVAGATT